MIQDGDECDSPNFCEICNTFSRWSESDNQNHRFDSGIGAGPFCKDCLEDRAAWYRWKEADAKQKALEKANEEQRKFLEKVNEEHRKASEFFAHQGRISREITEREKPFAFGITIVVVTILVLSCWFLYTTWQESWCNFCILALMFGPLIFFVLPVSVEALYGWNRSRVGLQVHRELGELPVPSFDVDDLQLMHIQNEIIQNPNSSPEDRQKAMQLINFERKKFESRHPQFKIQKPKR